MHKMQLNKRMNKKVTLNKMSRATAVTVGRLCSCTEQQSVEKQKYFTTLTDESIIFFFDTRRLSA